MVLDALARGQRAEADANSEWSAGYYLSNATHRLNAAAGKLGVAEETATLRTDQAFQPKRDAELARLRQLVAVLAEQSSR